MDTAERIFYLLDQSGMEQKKFAELIGATDKIVSKWRTSGLKSYRKYLPQIAKALNTSVEYLLNGEEKSPPPTEGGGLSPAKRELLAAVDDLSDEQCEKLLGIILEAKRLL